MLKPRQHVVGFNKSPGTASPPNGGFALASRHRANGIVYLTHATPPTTPCEDTAARPHLAGRFATPLKQRRHLLGGLLFAIAHPFGSRLWVSWCPTADRIKSIMVSPGDGFFRLFLCLPLPDSEQEKIHEKPISTGTPTPSPRNSIRGRNCPAFEFSRIGRTAYFPKREPLLTPENSSRFAGR